MANKVRFPPTGEMVVRDGPCKQRLLRNRANFSGGKNFVPATETKSMASWSGCHALPVFSFLLRDFHSMFYISISNTPPTGNWAKDHWRRPLSFKTMSEGGKCEPNQMMLGNDKIMTPDKPTDWPPSPASRCFTVGTVWNVNVLSCGKTSWTPFACFFPGTFCHTSIPVPFLTLQPQANRTPNGLES